MNNDTRPECRICAIASGQTVLNNVDRPWLNGDRYIAFTSIGALLEGWTLVSPRTHSINLIDHYSDSIFSGFVQETVAAIEELYGPVAVFEHGGQIEGSETNCGTSHAHLHVVPVTFSLQRESISFDDKLSWFRCSLRDIKERVGKQEYLFVADHYSGTSTTGDVCILRSGQSQFFRRVIAQKLGREQEFDYKTHPNIAVANAGSAALRLLADRLKAA